MFAEVLGEGEGAERLSSHVCRRATIASLTELFAGSGFAIRRVVDHVSWMRFASGRALLNHHFIKFAFLPAWVEVAGDPAVMRELEERLNRRAIDRGGLNLTIPGAYLEATRPVER